MFRAAIVTIVLILGIGPSTALLFGTWCDVHAVTAGTCHHSGTTGTSVAGGSTCHPFALSDAIFLPQDVRRGVPAPKIAYASVGPRHQLASSTADFDGLLKPGPEWSYERRPLRPALRI